MTVTAPVQSHSGLTRWGQLACGLVCMMAIASPQYVWTLFTKPVGAALAVSPAALQVTFSLLIVLQTFFSPFQGWLVDRFGPRRLIGLGCVLSGLSWVLASYASSLTMFYLTYGLIGGLGTGIVYVGVVGQMVRWFPEKRGFAAGMAAAGYGFGAMLTTFPISNMLARSGYQHTLLVFGAILAVVGMAAAALLKSPPHSYGVAVAKTAPPKASDMTSVAMLKTPIFWLMFVMMTMMSTGGLMIIVQFATFSREFGITDKVLVLGFAALPLALTLDRVTNGLTRPCFGWISDRIGRENTMAIAFVGEGLAILVMLALRSHPLVYVLMSGVVFFGWGEIFSLFPSILTDTFGERYATTNYGFLYMAQGIGSVLGGPVAALIHDHTGSWLPVFGLIVVMDILTGLLALLVLKPMRKRWSGSGLAVA